MHSNIIVLISVTLLAVLVQNSHTFRVASKNGNYYRQEQQPVGAHSDEIGSLSDLLYLTDNDDLGGDSTEDDEESGELLKLLPKLSVNANNNNRHTADEYDEYFAELNRISQQQQPSSVAAAQSPSSSSSSANNSPVDEEELESHSSLVGGQVHQYVSGGAGEGKQHLQPDGAIDNKEEVKSDEDLPAYCDPPNPCPIGVLSDDCDPRTFDIFTAQYSKNYQEQQNCMCDDDHNECHKRAKTVSSSSSSGDRVVDLISNLNDKFSKVVAKKSPRVRREANTDQNETRKTRFNPYLRGQAINIVAKKSSSF